MSNARYLVGDVFERLRELPDNSVDCVITSPPYLQLRAYLDADHPQKAQEVGQEGSPAAFLEVMLRIMDALWPVLAEDATFWINLGDTHSGSGGAGGDYSEGGLRAGQNRYDGTAKKARAAGVVGSDRARPVRRRTRKPGKEWPLDQSVCWVPALFGASLAYGRNILSGVEHRQWVTRPPVTWCKPNPMPGAVGRKFKTATELIVYGGKHQAHYWDVDPVREPLADAPGNRYPRRVTPTDRDAREQVTKPIIVGCPPGGTVLDPFAGSGTTLQVATGHGRDAIGIDLDPRNAELAYERIGGLFLTIEDGPLVQDVATGEVL